MVVIQAGARLGEVGGGVRRSEGSLRFRQNFFFFSYIYSERNGKWEMRGNCRIFWSGLYI